MHIVAWWSSLFVLVVASVIDIRTRRIPNWLSAPYFVAGIVAQAVTAGWGGVVDSLAGIGLAVLLLGPGCYLRWMGMGDLKLAAGVAAWIGPHQFLFSFIIMSIAAGVIAAGYSLRKGCLLGPPSTSDGRENVGSRQALAIPYAPAIAIGGIFALIAQ